MADESVAQPGKAKRGCWFYGVIASGVVVTLLVIMSEIGGRELDRQADDRMTKAESLPMIDPAEVQAAFRANEIAAEARYGDLAMRVPGTVSKVQEDIVGDVQVLVEAGDYDTAVITLGEKDKAHAAELSPGDRVMAVCLGARTAVASVFFQDCRLMPPPSPAGSEGDL